ncbi:MAG: flippase-like domain-containing protein [Anaerolineae bacterium]|nr:flippase-like domain-containing protein [Anaerolineae bacterium]
MSTGIALVAVGIASYYIVTKLVESIRSLRGIEFALRPWPLVGSFGITCLCLVAGGMVWRLLLLGLGSSLELGACVRMHLMSNLGAYLPGYGWRSVGKAYLTRRRGLPLRVVGAAALIEFSALALTRLAVATTLLSRAFLGRLGLSQWALYLDWIRVLAWVILLTAPWLLAMCLNWLGQRSPQRWGGIRIRKLPLYWMLALTSANWVLYGWAVVLLFQALHPLNGHQIVPILFATTSSSLVSLILFVVPGGIAVRESVIIFVLEGLLPSSIVTLGALLSRITLLLAELLGASIGTWMSRAPRIMSMTRKD